MMVIRPKMRSICLRLIISVLLWPAKALAVQGHGGVEGLVAHQIGHTLLIFGICYLFYKIHRGGFKDSGWIEFKIFLALLVLWNLLTFSGHWMREFVDPTKFASAHGHVVSMTVAGPWDAYFYLTRLDHLLLVPSFILLAMALRKWRLRS